MQLWPEARPRRGKGWSPSAKSQCCPKGCLQISEKHPDASAGRVSTLPATDSSRQPQQPFSSGGRPGPRQKAPAECYRTESGVHSCGLTHTHTRTHTARPTPRGCSQPLSSRQPTLCAFVLLHLYEELLLQRGFRDVSETEPGPRESHPQFLTGPMARPSPQ